MGKRFRQVVLPSYKFRLCNLVAGLYLLGFWIPFWLQFPSIPEHGLPSLLDGVGHNVHVSCYLSRSRTHRIK